jgi:hypothetical protein
MFLDKNEMTRSRAADDETVACATHEPGQHACGWFLASLDAMTAAATSHQAIGRSSGAWLSMPKCTLA